VCCNPNNPNNPDALFTDIQLDPRDATITLKDVYAAKGYNPNNPSNPNNTHNPNNPDLGMNHPGSDFFVFPYAEASEITEHMLNYTIGLFSLSLSLSLSLPSFSLQGATRAIKGTKIRVIKSVPMLLM